MMQLLFLTSLVAWAGVDEAFLQHVRATQPLPAETQAQRFHVPEQFAVQLVASETQLQKPMNLAFDARGRLWVTGSIEYPYPAKACQGRDTIKVIEINASTGRASKITTFAGQLNIPMGLYPYRDGCIVYSIPQILFLRDTDGDGKADRREVLYDGLGWPRDTHGMQNAFRRGADGWLYVNHGFANDTTITGRDGSSIHLNSGNTYRIRLDGSRVEQYTWGQVNPFGSAWTDRGELITADCHSKPLTLLLRGAHYSSFGKPHDGLGFAPDLMSHQHGSTGLAGVAYYEGGAWPREYGQSLFVGNVVTSRIHRDRLVFHQGTASAEEQADFLTCDDPWFRPVDMRFGPDGALYIADFYNRIIGHYEVPLDHPGRDRHRGRIWRVVYRPQGTVKRRESQRRSANHGSDKQAADDVAPDRGDTSDRQRRRLTDLTRMALSGLIERLNSPRLTLRYLAMEQITDRLAQDAVPDLQKAMASQPLESSNWRRRVMLRWCLFRLGQLSTRDRLQATRDPHPVARFHAYRLLAESQRLTDELHGACIAGLSDSDVNVQRAAADALGQHPRDSASGPLVQAINRCDARDAMRRHAFRLALRNVLRQSDAARAAIEQTWTPAERSVLCDVAVAVDSSAAARLMLDHLKSVDQLDVDTAPQVMHVVQHVSSNRFGQLLNVVGNTAHWPATRQVELVSAINRRATQLDDSTERHRFRTWALQRAGEWQASQRLPQIAWHVDLRETRNPWGRETRRLNDGQEVPFLSSLPGGEQQRSRLISSPFAIPSSIRFWLCGHRGNPDQVKVPAGDRDQAPRSAQRDGFSELSGDNYVQLRLFDSGRVVRRAYPPRSDTAKPIRWNLEDVAGKRGVLEIVDDLDHAAYAWIAVARFAPIGVQTAEAFERSIAHQTLLAELAAGQQFRQFRDDLATWINTGVDASIRSAAADAWIQLGGDRNWLPFARLLKDSDVSPSHRLRLAAAFSSQNTETIEHATSEILAQLTAEQQRQIVQQWVQSFPGVKKFLAELEHGNVNIQLVRSEDISTSIEAVLASHDPSEEANRIGQRFSVLRANLPDERQRTRAAIQATLAALEQNDYDVRHGRAVFEKHCATCHQLRGEGGMVGPQLDGIGKRGMTRLTEDILAPSRNVDPTFRTSVLTTIDGRALSGLLRKVTERDWQLVDSEGKVQSVDSRQVTEQATLLTSIMPENFVEILSVQQRCQLLEFLRTMTN